MSRRLFRGSLRSRPLPAFGRTPPFHCRFAGEKSASLAPPPGLRPYSPVSLPFHGGEVRFARAPSRPLAVLPRFTAVSRGRSPLRSRPLPAFGTSPPFHCRSTGENLITDLPWRGEDQGRHHVPRVVRRAIGCFHRGAGHRGRDPRGGVDRPPPP